MPCIQFRILLFLTVSSFQKLMIVFITKNEYTVIHVAILSCGIYISYKLFLVISNALMNGCIICLYLVLKGFLKE